MLAEDEFLRSPPRKTVRFGGTLAEILLKYQQGKTTEFDLLKHQLLDPDIKDDQIINWLAEFRSSITFLTKEFEQLITILLKVPWLRRSRSVVEEYLAFLSNLVSAQTIYLRPCLQMIVSHFVPPRITIRENDVDISDSDDDENVVESFTTCHRALQTIVKYVPLTPQFLMPVLAEKFPFINKSERTLQCYLHNLLRISVYIPALRHDILELVVEKLLKIDVSAPRKDIEAAEEEEEGNGEKGLFNMDEDGENLEKSELMAHPIAERLDILMVVMFSYIKDVCYVNGKIDVGNTKDLYRDLVAIFDKLILTTHGSCHVQFIVFYLSSFRLVIAEAFVEHLWKKLQNPNVPAVIRQTTGNYIGSFLARAKFIPIVTVKACLDLLVSWLHTYIDNQGTGSRAFCDVALHGPFYAACQAVFYIVIFRHKQILDGNLKKGLAYLQRLNFERIVLCQLNPLKVCLPTIVSLFAALTRKYQVAFCDTIIERNRRQILPVVRSSCGGESVETVTNPLDSFFPFDPYILKRSKNTVNPLYQFWEEQSAEDLKETPEPVNEDSLKQLLEMFPSSSSREPQNITPGCVPFESYFSCSGITDLKTPKLTTEKPQVEAMYFGDPLPGASTGVNVLNMFTQPRVSQIRQRRVPRKIRRTPKNTLVLEVEGTLALSSLTAAWEDASTFTIPFQDRFYQVSIKLRPHLPEFLEELAKIYEIFVFTTAKQDYADQMLKVLGPQRKLIRHQLYQEDCLCRYGSYVKDLSVVERDLDRTVAVATCLQAFPYQMSNVIVVPKWLGDPQDKELLYLIPALRTISQAADIRTEIERKRHGKGKVEH